MVIGVAVMLNLLSLRCGLAFAPYLSECACRFLGEGLPISKVIRQGGTGLIVRSEEAFSIRYQNREAKLDRAGLSHYWENIAFRGEHYDILLTSDEVVLASIGAGVLLSHPQSELWLDAGALLHIVAVADGRQPEAGAPGSLPNWLTVSTGGGRLLLSDQRNGRWVLLGSDHIDELRRRRRRAAPPTVIPTVAKPPTILLKGVTVHLQSAMRLSETLRTFAATGVLSSFEEVAPEFSLRVARSSEGIELSDSNERVGLTSREANKWAGVIAAEIARLSLRQIDRGAIRTVIADGEGGRWILQWGDEVFVPSASLARLRMNTSRNSSGALETNSLVIRRVGTHLLILSDSDASCVNLTVEEVEALTRMSAPP